MVQEYPRHVHKAGGDYLVVDDDEQKAAALADGWSLSAVFEESTPATVTPIPKKRGRPPKVAAVEG